MHVAQFLIKTSIFPLQLCRTVFEDSFIIGGRGFPYHLEDFDAYPCLPQKSDLHKKTHKEAPWYQSEADVFNLFKVILCICTKLFLRQWLPVWHPECLQEFVLSKLQLPWLSLIKVICTLLFSIMSTLTWGLWGKMKLISKHSAFLMHCPECESVSLCICIQTSSIFYCFIYKQLTYSCYLKYFQRSSSLLFITDLFSLLFFQTLRMKILTNTKIKKPVSCIKRDFKKKMLSSKDSKVGK